MKESKVRSNDTQKKKQKKTKNKNGRETYLDLVKYNMSCGKSDILDFRLQKKEVHTQS